MPPKKTAAKKPVVPLTPLYEIAVRGDLAELLRNNPVIPLLQAGFREASAFNEEARDFVQDEFSKKPPATPKKTRDKLNRVVEEIDHLIAPVALNFDELADGQEGSSPMPSTTPVRPGNATSTPKRAFSTSRPTPRTQPINNGLGSSRPQVQPESPRKARAPVIVKPVAMPTRIPKPPKKIVKPVEQKSKDEEGHMTAEERKKQALHEKAERARLEREEKEAKVRERQRQIEEEKQRAADGYRNHHLRLKKFEEANKIPCSPRTPVREAPKAKEIITPRRIHVPVKKGRELPGPKDNVVVSSPQLKRKPAGRNKKAMEVLEPTPTPEPTQSRQPPQMHEQHDESEDVVMDNEAELHYEEVSPEEAEALYNKTFNNDNIESFEQHEADIQHDDAQAVQSEDLFGAQTPAQISRSEDLFAPTPTLALSQPSDVHPDAIRHVNFEEQMDAEAEEEEETDAGNNYDMTQEKIPIPSTAENYNLEDLSSNDETDDESRPRKEVPKWARKENLRPAVLAMEARLTIDERAACFGVIQEPSIALLFKGHRTTRARKSSQVWSSPFANPTPGESRLPKFYK